MKNIILLTGIVAGFLSCSKIEEEKDRIVLQTQETIQRKTEEAVKETIGNSINNLTNAEDVLYGDVFAGADSLNLTSTKGKKIKFPNGSEAYVFKYTGDKEAVLSFLENQPTTDEAGAGKKFKKIDGSSIMQTFSFIEKFLPESQAGLIPTELKNDSSIEYYRLKRAPNSSTLIYSPRSNTFYHYLEILK